MTHQEELILRGLELKMDRLLDYFSAQKTTQKNEEKLNEIESEWITLKEACTMMESYSLASVRARADLQPCMGHGTMIGRNKCWRKDQIIEWLNSVSSPQARKAYQQKYTGGVQ